jgi:hypothetical protein
MRAAGGSKPPVMPRSKNIGRNRPDRVKDLELHWANKAAAAKTPRAQAVVEWDRLRREVSQLPEGEQKVAWRDLAAALAQRRRQITKGHSP